MPQGDSEMTNEEAKNKFDRFPDNFKELLSAAMMGMTVLGNITNGFRAATGEDREVALSVLNYLHEVAPTRHKKELALAMRNATQRFWVEKDAGMLPVNGEIPVAH